MVNVLSAAVVAGGLAAAVAKPDGTCGYQCTADSECSGCGTAGKCSCPDGKDVKFFQESCTCVSAPADAPKSPPMDEPPADWPQQWTADVEAWCYGDWSDKNATAKGKFYYDATRGKTRADWAPYINGKNAKQVWVGANKGQPNSEYYVSMGPVCIKFHITDPGAAGAQIGIEKPDWMASCKAAGFAHVVSREQVRVGSEDHWVDHWSCRLDYEAANQSITFQNWHSLGLGSIPKGLPVRVTGGNSAPNPTRGSPRLNTVWYTNFITGSDATTDKDFDLPNWGGKLCIPVSASETHAFFGETVQHGHVFSADFHRRAHFLPHAKPNKRDLVRAKTKKPGKSFTGKHFQESMQKLNAHLQRIPGLRTMACSDMTQSVLHETQRVLFDARSPHLDSVYQVASDTRRMAHGSLEALLAEQEQFQRVTAAAKAQGKPEVVAKLRDGLCHELVMWYVHHLSADAREEIQSHDLLLPLLPEVHHAELQPAADAHADEKALHARYSEQVSCAICHLAPSSSSEEAASIVV
eukprot:TRINITY_DN8629_c0_g1_i2.p1 TRINITY_DN8629_c0_g1~~TRINITY_DN8629_c0_g1_i2.p1  ORF type:complete len:523 (+),score=132.81 TRINITY_DN8629_c0_g1_i2:81-1649(+)